MSKSAQSDFDEPLAHAQYTWVKGTNLKRSRLILDGEKSWPQSQLPPLHSRSLCTSCILNSWTRVAGKVKSYHDPLRLARIKICMAKFCATVVLCITLMGTSNKGMLFMALNYHKHYIAQEKCWFGATRSASYSHEIESHEINSHKIKIHCAVPPELHLIWLPYQWISLGPWPSHGLQRFTWKVGKTWLILPGINVATVLVPTVKTTIAPIN